MGALIPTSHSKCILIPLAIIDLVQSMIAHSYPTKQICERTDLNKAQLTALSDELKGNHEEPLYDINLIDANLSPFNTHTLANLNNILGDTDEIGDKEVKTALKQIHRSKPSLLGQLENFQLKKFSSQLHIIRSIAAGTPETLAFNLLGFTNEEVKLWLEEDPYFRAALHQVKNDYGSKHIKNIEKASEEDWKASAWLLEKHPNVQEHYVPKEQSNAPVMNVTLSFKRSPIIPSEFEDAEYVDKLP